VRIINEPTAASLAYGLDKAGKEQKIMVFDLGGGTLDVTIMEFGGGLFEVKSTSGDTQLGGTDMDNVLVDYIVSQFRAQSGLDLRNDPVALQRVREAGEKAKIELSTTPTTEINLPFIAADVSGPKNLALSLTRSKLEELINPIIERCRHPTMQALQDAKLEPTQIDRIILVGGPTRMPIVRNFVEKIMGKPSERGVDPMECVATGASIQAAVLSGEVTDILLLDVTPLSLGVETMGGILTKIIDRNTTIPTKKSQIFTTAADFQTTVTIHVLQGERAMATDNVSLGNFNLTGIPPAPRGVPQVEVAFDIDANGILNVSAKDMATGKQAGIAITASTKLSDKEKERMVKEAEEYAEVDKKKREEAEIRNQADSLVYTTEKTKSDLKDKIPADLLTKLDNASKELKEVIAGSDIELIKQKSEALSNVLKEIGTVAYQQAAAASQASSASSGAGTTSQSADSGEQKVVDAEYKVDQDSSQKKD